MKFIDSIVKALIKEGFPGGVGVGLTLPNGYINGAPDNSDEDDKNEDIIPGGKAEGKSLLNPNTEREGLVIRSQDISISFKAISNKFLLKEK
jgi:hypothetical protein